MSDKLLNMGFVQKVQLNTNLYNLDGGVAKKGTEFYVSKTIDSWTIPNQPIEKYLIVSGESIGKMINIRDCEVIR